MPTINQLRRKPRRKPKKAEDRVLRGRPLCAAIVMDTFVAEPRKPNSGNRKCAHVRLKDGTRATAYIPGEGHNLAEHHTVLIRKGNTPDLSGVTYKVIRGALDCAGVTGRKSSRSRYGTRKSVDTGKKK